MDVEHTGAYGVKGLFLEHSSRLLGQQRPHHHLLYPAIGRGTESSPEGQLHQLGKMHHGGKMHHLPQGPWDPLPGGDWDQLVGASVELDGPRGQWQPGDRRQLPGSSQGREAHARHLHHCHLERQPLCWGKQRGVRG